MLNRFRTFVRLLPLAVIPACTAAHAEPAPTPAATMLTASCDSSYDVVGAIFDEEETESIDEVVFTDSSPFQCELTGPSQTVVFDFNQDATDPQSGCQHLLVRRLKDGGAAVGSSETLSCSNTELHYGVIAIPRAGDPDCSGLGQIEVDPKIQLKTKNCSGG